MDKITIVDRKDNVIGATTKEEALSKGLIRRISRIFLIDENKIYLQRRGPDMQLFPNTWDQSAGGHVDEGESYEEAAIRELSEELGIVDVKLQELGKFYLEETFNGLQTYQFSTVFTASYNKQTLKFQREEVSGGKWFTIDEIDKNINANPEEFATGFLVTWEGFRDRIL